MRAATRKMHHWTKRGLTPSHAFYGIIIHRTEMQARRKKRAKWRDITLAAHALAVKEEWPCHKQGKMWKVKVLEPGPKRNRKDRRREQREVHKILRRQQQRAALQA